MECLAGQYLGWIIFGSVILGGAIGFFACVTSVKKMLREKGID